MANWEKHNKPQILAIYVVLNFLVATQKFKYAINSSNTLYLNTYVQNIILKCIVTNIAMLMRYFTFFSTKHSKFTVSHLQCISIWTCQNSSVQ